MKRYFQRVACMAALLLTGASAQGATITLSPSSTNVTVGETFDIDITASDINLGGFELTIGFSPWLVSLLQPAEFFGSLGAPFSFADSAVGLDYVEADEISFVTDPAELIALQGDAALSNSFRLARLQFTAVAVGLANFDFLFNFLTDVDGFNQLSADVAGTSVNIAGQQQPPPPSDIPEPSTFALIGAGFLVAGLLRRKA